MHTETYRRRTSAYTRHEAEHWHDDAMTRGLDRCTLMSMRDLVAPDEILRATGLTRAQLLVAENPDVPCPLPSHVLHRAAVAATLAAGVTVAA